MDTACKIGTSFRNLDGERLTCAIDRGLGVRAAKDLVETASTFISLVKLGWGTGWITWNLDDKLTIYHQVDIPVCFGGTLFEWAIHRGNMHPLLCLMHDQKIAVFEVSDGTISMTQEEKCAHITRLAEHFIVFSEVGTKELGVQFDVGWWIESIQAELEAGATKVILEGRESGTVGVYDDEGRVDASLIERITRDVPHENLIFEAPQKEQQVWFIKHFGPDVNLGNVATDDVIPLETLRQGLRADTLLTEWS